MQFNCESDIINMNYRLNMLSDKGPNPHPSQGQRGGGIVKLTSFDSTFTSSFMA